MPFSYQTNRIINSICEFCGIKSDICEHYKDGQPKPIDELEKLRISVTAPPAPKQFSVPPLSDKELAASPAEAKAAKDAFDAAEAEAKAAAIAESKSKKEAEVKDADVAAQLGSGLKGPSAAVVLAAKK